VGEVGLNYGEAKVGEVGGTNNTSGAKFSVASGANSNLHFGTNVNLNSETTTNLVSNENANLVSNEKANLANTNANSVSNENANFYAQSNAEFSNLDKEQGANNPLVGAAIAAAIVAGKVIWKVASKASSKIFTNGGKNALKKETREVANKELKYLPHKKHNQQGTWNGASVMDLSDDVAQKVLQESKQLGRQRYGIKDGKIYEFQSDNAGTYHGYEIPASELVKKKGGGGSKILKEWLKEDKITKPEYNKFIKNK